jgi:hypothetical protein
MDKIITELRKQNIAISISTQLQKHLDITNFPDQVTQIF